MISGLWNDNKLSMDAPTSILKESDFALNISVRSKIYSNPLNPEIGITKRGQTHIVKDGEGIPFKYFNGYTFTYFIADKKDLQLQNGMA